MRRRLVANPALRRARAFPASSNWPSLVPAGLSATHGEPCGRAFATERAVPWAWGNCSVALRRRLRGYWRLRGRFWPSLSSADLQAVPRTSTRRVFAGSFSAKKFHTRGTCFAHVSGQLFQSGPHRRFTAKGMFFTRPDARRQRRPETVPLGSGRGPRQLGSRERHRREPGRVPDAAEGAENPDAQPDADGGGAWNECAT